MWLILGFIGIALAVYAFIDVLRSEKVERAGIPQPIWMVLVIVLPILGPLGWLLASRLQRTPRHAPSATPKQSTPTQPLNRNIPGRRSSRPVAPDDDPEFLAQLARTLRREANGDPGEESPPEK